MKQPFKPSTYNSVSPYFIVHGAQRFIDFVKEVFNATELRRYDLPDGSIMHAEVMMDDSVLMIADSNESYPPHKLMLHVYVPDAHATYRRAIDAGAEAIEEPVRKENDPDLRGSFRDFAGNYWSIGTQQ
jgi:PhnB protein